MRNPLARRNAVFLLALPLLAACGSPAHTQSAAGVADLSVAPPAQQSQASQAPSVATQGTQTTQAAQATQAQPSLTAPAPAAALVFQIASGQSKATFRVREQLVGVQLPSDAVGATGAVTGRVVLRREGGANGVVGEASRIAVNLRELRTDDPRRDSFIKSMTLQTDQFPYAEFAPTRAEGLASPLPASGEHAFRLTGPMVIHGVQKDATWDVRARRAGAQLTARATTTVKFGDFGMTPPKAEPVVLVVDEIRLELDLAATQA